MRACMRAGRWQSVLELYERMVARGVDRTTHTLAPTLAACAKDPERLGWRRAHAILETEAKAMRSSHGSRPQPQQKQPRAGGGGGKHQDACLATTGLNVHCYTAAAQAYASGGRWQEATALLERMRMDRVRPNARTYTAVLSACGPLKRWRQALELLQGMQQEGVRPDAHCVNAALRVLGRAGEWEEAAALVRTMRAKLAVVPTAVHTTTAVGAMVRAGQLEAASDLIAELLGLSDAAEQTSAAGRHRRVQRMRLDAGLCDVGLGLCARLGQGDRAKQLIDRLAADTSGRAELSDRMRHCVALATGTSQDHL